MVFGFKERPCQFFSNPRPRRGRHVLAPRDPSDPATLPILRRTAATAAPPIRLSPRRSFPIPSGQGGENGGGWVAHQRTCARAASVSVSYPILVAESRSPGPRRPRRAVQPQHPRTKDSGCRRAARPPFTPTVLGRVRGIVALTSGAAGRAEGRQALDESRPPPPPTTRRADSGGKRLRFQSARRWGAACS